MQQSPQKDAYGNTWESEVSGDGIGIVDTAAVAIEAIADSELLIMEVPL